MSLSFNARSICNKWADICYIAHPSKYAMVSIVETWLLPDLKGNLFNIPSYQCYFSSRKRKKGEGVMMAVSNELIIHECNISIYKFPSPCKVIAVYVKNIRLVWETIYTGPHHAIMMTQKRYLKQLVMLWKNKKL